ncbi:3-hydroxyacyl-CoA dehydrogenase [Longispora fulva]|uniref:3-hydroxyacyl-CoA dehydrogenase/enoyl-CoA hydratase/3-hydroxybutyryl-CoA epimerase n=1 Tax=Longispora fulva TaxID=619741 RepID=A0A8J7GJX7_9ACTN|nr:3-hydroxyacyl-CoA dehydrogenase NAD-binding domain-containing protein [Longispora fulva]MBG6137930.1 3-hydroxyacyl-CoA dehydrogenase/enoyl-CoA hydratase/3-hydroxybutyryl-CoA epimerase [Longispora fulva]GIG60183.1 3-hydroxyacyl-CoA dehydrogenase [Longispora fulva]
MTFFHYDRDSDGIVTLALDDAGPVPTMDAEFRASLRGSLDRLVAEEDLRGVIVTSRKKAFLAGAELTEFLGGGTAQTLFDMLTEVKADLRRLETLGKPVVAAVNGTALGGGLELALACHHRIASDDPRAEYGLPEVMLGLLPGAGGVTRTVRMLGLADALMQVLLRGQRHRPEAALEAGIIDELAPAALVTQKAREWILSDPEPSQPWDRPGYRMPGGTPADPKLAATLPAFAATLSRELKGADYPAPRAILAAAVEGAQVDVDTALRIESRYLVSVATGQIARNMIGAFFFDLRAINSGASRPAGPPRWKATKAAVLGAGMMGAGIAFSCAKAGMEVVLKDVTLEAATRGRDAVAKMARRTPEILDRVLATDSLDDLAGCDLVIEAVFEDAALKQRLFAELEPIVAPGALLASNTSSLPITELATAVRASENFVGLHFFSPVNKMQTVEIIRAEKTSDEALARAYDVVLQIRKTPIVVNDRRGFFTSRVFGAYVLEGLALLGEGVPAATIEQAAQQAGYPVGPLAVLDEVTLSLPYKLRQETLKAAERDGFDYPHHPGEAVLTRMVEEFGRKGRSTGGGFYDYPEDETKTLWPGLSAFTGPGCDFAEIADRLLYAQTIETIRCVEEGVVAAGPDVNVGAILSIGFPPWTGGPLRFRDQTPEFAARAAELAERHGARFAL